MIIGFKEQFRAPILNGTKIHTIREDKHDRWKPGKVIHMSTGVRTKWYNCFKKDMCRNIQKIRIVHWHNTVHVYIDDWFFGEAFHNKLYDIQTYSPNLKKLARNDGFDSVSDFFKWFNHDFEGKIIHWTDFEY